MSESATAVALQAWREQGVDRLDPVRFRVIEALARRAQAHQGEVRRILDDKVARLLVAYGETIDKAGGATPPDRMAPERPRETALGALLKHMAQQASSCAPEGGQPLSHEHAPELKTMRDHKHVWSRLSADQRLKQSLARVPHNAGPLNSNQLVHRSLVLMRELSPAYLYRFLAYVDALSWIHQAQDPQAG